MNTVVKPSEKIEWKGPHSCDARVVAVDREWVIYYLFNEDGLYLGMSRMNVKDFIRSFKPVPQKKYVEWDDETAPKGFFPCVHKTSGDNCMAIYSKKFFFTIHPDGQSFSQGPCIFMKDYNQLDSTPCGAEVAE